MNKKIVKKISLGGRELVLEVGNLAFQANASVLAQYGGTVVLATVVSTKIREDLDYFPLQVEYIERLYAGGKIKGSRWVKREGRPSDEAVLAARLVDRAIRPLFPEGFKNDTQMVLTLLSVDHENEPEVLSAVAASAALHISDIPWNGPLGLVRIGRDQGNFVVNPINSQAEKSDLSLIIAFGKEGVVMIEGEADQVSEEEFLAGVSLAEKEGQKIIKAIEELRKDVGRRKMTFALPDPKNIKKIEELSQKEVREITKNHFSGKISAKTALDQLDALIEEVKEGTEGIATFLIREVINQLFKKETRKEVLKGKRADGRKPDEIRPLDIEIGLLPRTHGSAIFQRGETQTLTVTTLGPPSLKQLIEGPEGEESKRYIHHYFMPPYSVGSTGFIGWPKRREVGHGALAEKALLPVIPSEEKFPYTIRLVSEILSSNGSTSMASACGSSLSLMDAGVPISAPVAGISIGLVKEGENHLLLTDIAGAEDGNGDMDFKVTGTEKGITAVQLDIKIGGLSLDLVKEAIEEGRKARLKILEAMLKVIPQPRAKVSQYAPKVATLHIPIEMIGELIGPGGRTIRKLIEETDCLIDVEDDGQVSIIGEEEEAVAKAIEKIEGLTRKPEPGEIFEGTVTRTEPFGVFVEFLPGKEGLVHVSRMGTYVKDASRVLERGQRVKVKLYEIDERGRHNLQLIEPKIKEAVRPSRFDPRERRRF